MEDLPTERPFFGDFSQETNRPTSKKSSFRSIEWFKLMGDCKSEFS